MKFPFLRPALWLLLPLANACQPPEPSPAAEKPCHLTNMTRMYKNEYWETDETLIQAYDAADNMTQQTWSYRNNPGSRADQSSLLYTYDANGFVTNSTYQSRSVAPYGTGSYSTYDETKTFEYSNGRLSKETTQYKYDTKYAEFNTHFMEENFTIAYEYNAAGQTVRKTRKTESFVYIFNGMDISGDNSTIVTNYAYANGVLSGITKTKNGTPDNSTTYIFNAQGLVTSEKMNDDVVKTEYRYEYDAAGQMIKYETFEKNRKVRSYMYVHDDKKIPQVVNLKGHPQHEYWGKKTHNIIRMTYSSWDEAGVEFGPSKTETTYEYNVKGYPVRSGSVYLDKEGKREDRTSTSTFTYKDC